MTSFINSPVWAAVITGAGGMLSALMVLMFRLLGKVGRMDDKLEGVCQDITEIKNDRNIVRWSDLASKRIRRR